jgi:hypothetical protein
MKHSKSIIIFLFLLSPILGIAQVMPMSFFQKTTSSGSNLIVNGLVLHLDASNTASYPGSGTTWNDISGNNNNAALNSAVFTTTSGVSFFNFSATFARTTFVKAASMTFSSWAKTSDPANAMLFNAGNNFTGPDLFFWSNMLHWNVWDAGNSPFGFSTSNINTNWHNYTVVNNAVTNVATLYFDGVQVGTAVYRSPTYTTNFYIGGAGNGGDWGWKGGIANFQVYNAVLTAAEVLQNYNALKSRFGY